ncbi:MAG: hypothetical protein ACYC7E_07095 [Armatimonadota bacterium]
MRLYLSLVIALMLSLVFLLTAVAAPAAEKGPAILFLTFSPLWADMPDESHVQHLQQAGFQVDMEEAAKLTWERIKGFNVVVLYNLPLHGEKGSWPKEFATIPDLLRKYIDAGGGLFNAGLCATHGQTLVHNELLKHFDMAAPFERIVETDAGKLYKMPRMFGHRFALTSEIARDHPVTQGIRHLWYYCPGDGATLGEYPHPLTPLVKKWTVIAWGSPTARSIRMPNFGEITNEALEPPATFKSRPPLMAVRGIGQGRMAVTVMNQSHLINNGWHFAYEGLAMAKGDGTTPSDWEQLFLNAYRWLAEPSVASGAMGGFVAKEDAGTKAAAQFQAELRVGFDRTAFAPPSGNHFKGLIGARSAYSVGKGTVAEYVAAAKKSGYAWIVFSEVYEKMTEDKWNRLVADCARETKLTGAADDFLAIPGLEYPDQVGDRFISFGPVMGWLKADWLQRKRFGANEDMAVNYKFPDTILFELKNNKLDPHYLGQYYSIAIETYRGADQQVTANDLAQYARMQYLRYNLHPTAIHFIDEPGQVAKAAATGYQNYVHEKSLDQILGRISGYDSRYSHVKHPVSLYISQGPRIAAWEGRRTALGARDRYLGGEPIQHWEARLAVTNDVPLKEIRFQNGPDLLQRHLPNTPNLDQVYHGFHDRQYELFATVEDARGRKAVTSCLLVLQMRNVLVNCTDNRNIILGGQYGHAKTTPRGFEMYFNRMSLSCLPPDVPLMQPQEKLQPLNPITDSYEYFTSKDIVILDQVLKSTWPAGLVAHGSKVNGYPEAVAMPMQDFDYATRTYRFTTGKDKPELLLVEADLTFKRDLAFPEKPALDVIVARLTSGRSTPGDFQAFAVGDDKSATLHRRVSGAIYRSGEVAPGQYLAALPGLTGAGAIIPLDKPLLWWGAIDENRVDLHAGFDVPRAVKAGDRFTARYLYAIGNFGEAMDSTEFAILLRQLGIAGKPEYQVTPDAGKVLDMKVFLRAQAENGGFSARISKAPLPVDGLTVKVEGVNNRWSAGIWDRDLKILSRAGGRDGAVWTNVDLTSDRNVFIGNLLTCDKPELTLIYLEGDEKGCVFQAHNPTDQAITSTVRSHPKFDRITPFERQVTVPPGATVEVKI